MFPEGVSRYHSEMSPLKQGVSRIVSDTLTRRVERGDLDFKLAVQTVSMSYPQRNSFRSDVLITYHPPIYVSAKTHPDLVSTRETNTGGGEGGDHEKSPHERAIRSLTSTIGSSIRSGILDAPSWSHLRAANTARRLYAPLGTKLTLGDHVRLTQRFVDALAGKRAEKKWDEIEEEKSRKVSRENEGPGGKKGEKGGSLLKGGKAAAEEVWKTPMREKGQGNKDGYFAIPSENGNGNGNGSVNGGTTDGGFSSEEDGDDVKELLKDLKVSYLDLSHHYRVSKVDLHAFPCALFRLTKYVVSVVLRESHD